MAYPPAYTRAYSFTDWETTHPGEPKPGAQLDAEYDGVSNALTATQDALALIQRADGALANGSVGVDQLDPTLFDGIADAAVADAEAAAAAAAASASTAAGSASSAAASASAASASASTASGAAAQAGVSQGIAQTAATEAANSADEAADSATAAANSANQAQGFRNEAGMHEETAFDWAEKLEGPVMPAPPGWPEAVDDGMFSAKWWAIRARDYNGVTNIDLGSGQPDIGDAWDEWLAIPGNEQPPGLVYATWGVPPEVYILTDPNNPSDPASWTSITGPTGPMGPPGTGGLADPTALLGLTMIPGVSTAGMRSDAAPALNQAIAPTWTGEHTFNATVDLAGPVEAAGVEGLNGQVLASQGAGLPLVFRNAGSGSIELGYNFAVAVGTADPGNQKLSLNSAVYAAVTQIQFDDLAFGNFDAQTILSLLSSGNRIYIQARADATRAVVYQVTGAGTDNGGHWSIPVSIIASRGALFAANADLTCVFILSSSSIAVANPTATIGLTAVNGSAATAMRSDAAPPLSQAIVPTWTGAHRFNGADANFFAAIIGGDHGLLGFSAAAASVDRKNWSIRSQGNLFTVHAYNDAWSAAAVALQFTHGTGGVVGAMSFGNATDNPTYSFLGTGLTTHGGSLEVSGDHISVIGADVLYEGRETDQGADGKVWWTRYTSGTYVVQTRTDAGAAGNNAMQFARTGTAVTQLVFGNATNNPTYQFLGTGAVRADGGFQSDSGLKGVTTPGNIIRPNAAIMTYGSVYVAGAVGGHTGYSINDGLAAHFMSDGSSVVGIFIQADGKWLLYRSSSTNANSGYGITAPSFTSTSSRAIKRETGAPSKVSDILSRLRPILYRLLAGDDREQLGLIAEEVRDVCPQLSDGKSVSYDRLAILLLAAWQDQHAVA